MNYCSRNILLFLWTTLLLASCTAQSPVEEAPQAQESNLRRSAFIPGVTVVQVSEALAEELASGSLQTKSGEVNSAFDRLGIIRAERVFPDAGEWEPRHREAGLHTWFRLYFDPDSAPVTKAAEDLSSVPGIISAEPQHRIRSTAYFNDPKAPQQWELYNHGFASPNYKDGCDVNVLPAWDVFTAGSKDVIVAVLDEGVQLDHEDLAASCIPAGSSGSQSFVYGHTGSKLHPGSHGTHVAGIIGAVNNNGKGISSIAGGYDGTGGVRIMSCAMLMEDPEDPEKTIGGYSENAFVWAADHGAVIANNSWSYAYENKEDALNDNIQQDLAKAINYFIQYAGCDSKGNQRPDSPMRGGLVLFAAGNDDFTISWPAAYTPVLAVGSIASNGKRAYYSNYGNWVDICAPGGDLKLGPGILSTIVDNGYDSYQGTSMACPQVAGVAALLVSHFGGPGFTCDMLKERLLNGANYKIAPGNIGPLVDAMGSFSYGGRLAPDPVTDASVSVSANTVTVSWTVTQDKDDVKALGYQIMVSKNPEELIGIDPYFIPKGIVSRKFETGRAKVGETISGVIHGLDFTSRYYVAIAAYDYLGHYSDVSAPLTVDTGENNPPVITADYTGEIVLKAHQKPAYGFRITEPDGHAFTLSFDGGSEAFSPNYQGNGILYVSLVGKAAPAGRYTATITATDEFGLAASYSFDYEILQNHPPVLIRTPENLIFDGAGQSTVLTIADYIRDEDEEPLNFELASSDKGVIEVLPNGDDVKISAKGYGVATAGIVASDISGTSCTLELKVLVRDPSLPVEISPNPVKSVLTIRPRESGTLKAVISNKAGATVFSGTAEVNPFEPMEVDMAAYPSGTYYVRLEGCGLNDRYTVAKI